MTPRRPILGFGLGGVLAGVFLLLLLWMWIAGVDVRYGLLVGIDRVLGIDAVFVFVSYCLLAYSLTLSNPVVGPVSLLYVLPVLHVSPGRRPWWLWASALVFALGAPLAWWWLMIRLSRGATVPSVFLPMKATALMDLVLVCVVFALTRSWKVTGIVVGATGLAMLGTAFLDTLGLWQATPWIWHGILAAVLVAWAVRARVYQPPPHLCVACGYDLSGLSGAVCPECGEGAKG